MFGVLTLDIAKPDGFFEAVRFRVDPSFRLSCFSFTERMSMIYVAAVRVHDGAPQEVIEKRLRMGLEWLRKSGVRRVVAPERAYETLPQYGMAPIRSKTGLHACAAQGVAEALQQFNIDPKGVCITLQGARIGREVRDAILNIATRVRALKLDFSSPDEDLEAKLMREYGLVCSGPPPAGCVLVTVLLEPDIEPAAGLVLNFTGNYIPGTWHASLKCDERVMQRVPKNAPAGEFITALYLTGGITIREIAVTGKNCLDIETAMTI